MASRQQTINLNLYSRGSSINSVKSLTRPREQKLCKVQNPPHTKEQLIEISHHSYSINTLSPRWFLDLAESAKRVRKYSKLSAPTAISAGHGCSSGWAGISATLVGSLVLSPSNLFHHNRRVKLA